MFLSVQPGRREELFQQYQNIKKGIRTETVNDKIQTLDRFRENTSTFAPIILAQQHTTDELEKTLRFEEQNFQQTAKITDKTYKDTDLGTFFGTKQITVGSESVLVDGKEFPKTEGFWNLVTLKEPGGFTDEEAEQYKEFLKTTGWLHTTRGTWRSITNNQNNPKKALQIQAQHEWKGTGVTRIFLSSNKNELIARLQLLAAEFAAGNKTTREEMVQILDELKAKNAISHEEYAEINEKLFNYVH